MKEHDRVRTVAPLVSWPDDVEVPVGTEGVVCHGYPDGAGLVEYPWRGTFRLFDAKPNDVVVLERAE